MRRQMAVGMFTALVFASILGAASAEPPASSGGNASAAQQASTYPFEVTVSGKGRPIIFIPGLACSGDVWRMSVDHFSANYECHVLTIHGFAGLKPFDGPFVETVRDGIAKYIADKQLQKPVVVGHSIGGFLTYVLGIEKGESVGPLISIDGLPFLASLANPKVTQEQAQTMAASIEKQFATLSQEQYTQSQARTLALWIRETDKRIEVATWGAESDVPFVGRAMAAMLRRDLRSDAAKITSPVLLIGAGAAPANTDAMHQAYEDQIKAIPHHKLVFAENSHHFVMYDEPEWMWEQIEAFLKANP